MLFRSMAIEESKDIDKIPLTELVGNLQTYELGLTRIAGNPVLLNLKGKTKGRRMLRKVISTLFP